MQRIAAQDPERLQPGERVFSVPLQGAMKLASLDVVQEAGGRNRALVREFAGVDIGENLLVELTPLPGSKVQSPVLSGVEVLPEGW